MSTSLRRIYFTVDDPPRPLGRPRFTMVGGHAHAYTPRKDQDVRFNIRMAWERLGEKAISGPIRMEITAWLPMPKSISRKRRSTAMPITRPDLDNYIKQVQDALEHYAFFNDSQIVTIIARKRYVGDPDYPDGSYLVDKPCWQITLDAIEVAD